MMFSTIIYSFTFICKNNESFFVFFRGNNLKLASGIFSKLRYHTLFVAFEVICFTSTYSIIFCKLHYNKKHQNIHSVRCLQFSETYYLKS